jgi:uncharacterized protein (DUF1697 family)
MPKIDTTPDDDASATSTVIALLRGINVGGNKRVPMSDLRKVLTELGFTDVKTYLQSGNAIFGCRTQAVEHVAADVEGAVARHIGVECSVIVRTREGLDEAIACDPWREMATDGAKHLVGFLVREPDARGKQGFEDVAPDPNEVQMVGRHLYLWCPEGIATSRFAGINWMKVLRTPITARNWNTVTKLAVLAAESRQS